MATFSFNAHRQFPTQPRPDEVHCGTSSRQSPKRPQISQLDFWPSLHASPDPVAAHPTPAGDPTLEDLLLQGFGSRRRSLSNQSFHPWDPMEPHNSRSLVSCPKASSENEFWWQTFEQPLSAEAPSSTGSVLDGVQSKPDSLLHLATSSYLELGNSDLRLDSLANVEHPSLGVGRPGIKDYFQESILPDPMLANFNSSHIFHDDNEWPLDPASFSSLSNVQDESMDFLDRNESRSYTQTCGQAREDLSYQPANFGFQMDMLDEYSKLQPTRGFRTTHIPPSLVVLSKDDPLPSLLWPSIGVTQDSDTWRSPDTHSTDMGPPAVSCNIASNGAFCDSENLRIDQSMDKGVQETENTRSIKTLPTKRRRLLEPTNWQHISSTECKPHEEITDVKHQRKTGGRRNGRLNAETAKNAQKMRHIRACLPCSILKIKCTPGDVCKRCSMRGTPLLGRRICTRARLDDYTDLFFPVSFVSHLELASVGKLSRELSLGFIGIDVEVDFTCGCEYPPMKLAVSEFVPKSDDLARAPTLTTGSLDRVASFQYQYPPPIASRIAFTDLIETCRNHVKLVVMQQRKMRSPLAQRGNKLSKDILEAIIRYHGSASPPSNISLLDKALMLNAIYYFMGTTLTITNVSKEYVTERLQKPTMRSYDSNLISRLLNRQIKSAMHAFRRELMREVLEELERELKTKSKAAWAICFSVASVLCICVEEAQTAMDAFTMHTRVHGAERESPSSEATIETCRKLDDLLFSYLLDLFHGIYKTHQISKTQNSSRIYNPIRDWPGKDIQKSLDHDSAHLVIEIRHIIVNHKSDIAERATRPPCSRAHDSLAQHMAFREGNSARLLSSFLESFHFT